MVFLSLCIRRPGSPRSGGADMCGGAGGSSTGGRSWRCRRAPQTGHIQCLKLFVTDARCGAAGWRLRSPATRWGRCQTPSLSKRYTTIITIIPILLILSADTVGHCFQTNCDKTQASSVHRLTSQMFLAGGFRIPLVRLNWRVFYFSKFCDCCSI